MPDYFSFFFTGCAHLNAPVPESRDELAAAKISGEQVNTISSPVPQTSGKKPTGSFSAKFGPEKITIPTSQDYGTAGLPDPLIIPDVDIKEKSAYIHNAKEILKSFRQVACDNLKNVKAFKIEELEREANTYINICVKPIIDDFAVNGNFETKLEIAKLHLLTAFIYSDVGGYIMAERYLDLIDTHYGKDKFLLSLSIDPTDIGYPTLSITHFLS